MEERKDPELDLEKELSGAPLKQRGFSDGLRRQIEARLDERSARRAAKRSFTVAACGIVTTLSVFFLLSDSRADVPAFERNGAAGSTAASAEPSSPAMTSEAEQPAAPIRSALLIGFRQDFEAQDDKRVLNVTKASTYRTLLIAPDCSGKLRVAAEGSGILMPYRQWFWKIEALTWESATDTIHYLVARRADQPAKPETFADIPDEELKHSEKLLYAANQYVSVAESESSWRGNAPAEYNRISVKKVTQLGSNRVIDFASNKKDPNRVTLQDVYGSEASERLETMLAAPKVVGMFSELNGDSWTIKRRPGRWIALAAETYAAPNNHAEGYELRELSLPLPESATSYDTLSLKWNEIKAVQPMAKDALTSPLDDMAAVFAGDWLYLYPYQKPLKGDPLLTVSLQPGETMVMAQWATGSYVEEWVRKAKLYLQGTTNAGRD